MHSGFCDVSVYVPLFFENIELLSPDNLRIDEIDEIYDLLCDGVD